MRSNQTIFPPFRIYTQMMSESGIIVSSEYNIHCRVRDVTWSALSIHPLHLRIRNAEMHNRRLYHILFIHYIPCFSPFPLPFSSSFFICLPFIIPHFSHPSSCPQQSAPIPFSSHFHPINIQIQNLQTVHSISLLLLTRPFHYPFHISTPSLHPIIRQDRTQVFNHISSSFSPSLNQFKHSFYRIRREFIICGIK